MGVSMKTVKRKKTKQFYVIVAEMKPIQEKVEVNFFS